MMTGEHCLLRRRVKFRIPGRAQVDAQLATARSLPPRDLDGDERRGFSVPKTLRCASTAADAAVLPPRSQDVCGEVFAASAASPLTLRARGAALTRLHVLRRARPGTDPRRRAGRRRTSSWPSSCRGSMPAGRSCRVTEQTRKGRQAPSGTGPRLLSGAICTRYPGTKHRHSAPPSPRELVRGRLGRWSASAAPPCKDRRQALPAFLALDLSDGRQRPAAAIETPSSVERLAQRWERVGLGNNAAVGLAGARCRPSMPRSFAQNRSKLNTVAPALAHGVSSSKRAKAPVRVANVFVRRRAGAAFPGARRLTARSKGRRLRMPGCSGRRGRCARPASPELLSPGVVDTEMQLATRLEAAGGVFPGARRFRRYPRRGQARAAARAAGARDRRIPRGRRRRALQPSGVVGKA